MPSSAGAEPHTIPVWERRYPGRMAYELARLEDAGACPSVDQNALSQGVLVVDLCWQLDIDEVVLRASYPDGFPRLRPHVTLIGDPATFPKRHCNPVDGSLCLLGRDTAQWLPSWTLARLLQEQLADALRGTGEEDPQAEPAEIWWNSSFGLPDSYALIDSRWDIGNARDGFLTLRYAAKGGHIPQMQAAVTEIRDAANAPLCSWTSALPDQLRRSRAIAVPWIRVDHPFLPQGSDVPNIQQLLQGNPKLHRPSELATGLHGFLFGVAYPMEVALGQTGTGWLFGLVHGPKKAFGPKARARQSFNTVQTHRAGPADIGSRVPAVEVLRKCSVALFGLGAIGAPLALELARNGCKDLRILDFDTIEPGNSIRWPLGTSAWGRRKVDALQEFIRANYPDCSVQAFNHGVGRDVGDDQVLARIMQDADVAVDATAAYGVTTLIHDYASERSLPMVSLWATPPVQGGVVAHYVPGSGCPVCLEHHHNSGSIVPPPGLDDEQTLAQPPGCAERTFTGGSFDLQELSLEAFRILVDAVSSPASQSQIRTLSLATEGRRSQPLWRIDALTKHPQCHCH